MDAPAARLVDNDAGVGVQVVGIGRPDEERLVDRILALHAEEMDPAEAELVVKRDGLVVVVHDRQIHVGQSLGLEMLGQAADQGLADPRLRGLRIDGETPQGRAALRILEGANVIDAGDRADHVAGRHVLGHKIGDRPVVAARPEEVDRHRHHLALGVDLIDRPRVGFRGQAADREAPRLAPAGAVDRKIQPIGVGGVQEQLLRRLGQQNVGVADVEGDVAPVGTLGPQRLHEGLGGRKGLGEQEPSPAAVEHRVRERSAVDCLDGRLEALVSQALETMSPRTAGAGIRRHAAASTSPAPRPARAPIHAAA